MRKDTVFKKTGFLILRKPVLVESWQPYFIELIFSLSFPCHSQAILLIYSYSDFTNNFYLCHNLLACFHYEAYVNALNAFFHIVKYFLNSNIVSQVNLVLCNQRRNLQVSKVVDERFSRHIDMQLTVVSILEHIHLNLAASRVFSAHINCNLVTINSD